MCPLTPHGAIKLRPRISFPAMAPSASAPAPSASAPASSFLDTFRQHKIATFAAFAVVFGSVAMVFYGKHSKKCKTKTHPSAENAEKHIEMHTQMSMPMSMPPTIIQKTNNENTKPTQAEPVSMEEQVPTEAMLINAIRETVEKANQMAAMPGFVFPEAAIKLARKAAQHAEKYGYEATLDLAKFLVFYNELTVTIKAKSMSERTAITIEEIQSEIFKMRKATVPDMRLALKCISGLTIQDEQQSMELLMTQLDIAQRAEDSKKLLEVYNKLASRQNLDDMTAMAAFMVSPLVGKWSDTRRFGPRAAMLNTWEELHGLPLQNPDIPDYHVLYELSEQFAKDGDAPLADCSWESYHIKARFRPIAIVQWDDKTHEQHTESFVETSEWKEHELEGTKLDRKGAVAMLMHKSLATELEVPFAYNGRMNANEIYLAAYMLLDPQHTSDKLAERYELRFVRSDIVNGTECPLYSGKFIAEATKSTEHVRSEFDVEWRLSIYSA